jgi:hypothetical protein
MGLKNAFEEIATEGLLRRLMDQLRFSKDNADRMRIIVDNQPTFSMLTGNTTTSLVNAANSPLPFATNSWNIMDAREPMRDQSLMAFQVTRNRWTIT